MNVRPTKIQVQQRVEDILRIRLDGAEFHDVREFAIEQGAKRGGPWERPAGHKPLSDPTLWRYIAAADEAIRAGLLSSRKKRLRMHLARRRNLYAKAVLAGDLRAALSVLDSLAKLEGLYPSPDAALVEQVARLEDRLRAVAAATAVAPTPTE